VAAFMEAVAAGFTVGAEGDPVQAEAPPEGDQHLPALAIRAGHLVAPYVQAAPMNGRAPIVHDPLAIRSVPAREWGIPHRLVRRLPTGNGIRLAVQLEAAALRRLNPKPDPLQTQAAGGTSSVRIARLGQPA
jgi:hypothetical protein